MRIMHGTREIAGQGMYSVLGLRALGYDAKMATWDRHLFGYPCDICLEIDRKKKMLYPWYIVKIIWLFFYATFRFDTFHFHFGSSLLPGNMDLWLLRLMHKSLIVEFHGSDLRQPSEIKKHNQYYTFDFPDEPKKTKCNIKIAKYARHIIVHDEELLPYLPETRAKLHIVPLRVDVDRFEPIYPKEKAERVVIAHAPSNRTTKGSAHIIAAVEKLAAQYDIEFILIENLTHEEALEQYKRADIIVDQLIIGTYGVFSIEAMAMGKPVITYITDQMRETFPEELPIVSATIDNIGEVLGELINDGALRHRLGMAGRAYAKRYHDYRNIAATLYNIYMDKHEPVYGRHAFDLS